MADLEFRMLAKYVFTYPRYLFIMDPWIFNPKALVPLFEGAVGWGGRGFQMKFPLNFSFS